MQNYNLIQKFLHNLCFNFSFINKSLYEIEKLFFLKKTFFNNTQNQKHVFITGLPRSGTTCILNYIYSTGEYASLKYKNMPFLFSVNINSKVYNQKDFDPMLRAHNDRLSFNLNSPESFDEVFLNSFDSKEIKYEIINYISLILKFYDKNTYLSKNNKNYKRINFLKSIFPNSKFIIPFRHPLQHSISLLNQQNNFTNLQNKEKFILDYMNFLGHNEFGLNHKPWFTPEFYFNRNDINYWLEQWIKFYDFVYLKHKDESNYCKFVCYDKLDSSLYLKRLNNFLQIDSKTKTKFDISSKKNLDKFDNDLFLTAIELYEKLNIVS
jgi:hypothetical protein